MNPNLQNLEPGYDALHIQWAAQNHESKKLMSVEEQDRSFQKFVTESWLDKGNHSVSSAAKREQLLHGQLFLVSHDGGQTFHWETAEMLSSAVQLNMLEKLYFVSPTLESHTENLKELAENQAMAVARYNLENSGFSVESSEIEGSRLMFSVRHPKGHYTVSIDLNQAGEQPWNYEFTDLDHPEKSPETFKEGQMEQAFGRQDSRFLSTSNPLQNKANDAVNAANAVAAIHAVNSAMNLKNSQIMNMPSVQALAPKPRQVSGTVETEAQTKQPTVPTQAELEMTQRMERRKTLAKKLSIEMEEKRQTRTQTRSRRRRNWMTGAAVATTGAVAATGAGLFGLTYFVNFM